MKNVLLGTAVLIAAGALSVATDGPARAERAQSCGVVSCS
jgi:hypothetical protein